jgi:predicted MFS family arabinose efflux permease
VGTLGGGCERFAFAVGAPIAGVISDYGSYPALGLATAFICVLPMPFLLPVIARRRREQPQPALRQA